MQPIADADCIEPFELEAPGQRREPEVAILGELDIAVAAERHQSFAADHDGRVYRLKIEGWKVARLAVLDLNRAPVGVNEKGAGEQEVGIAFRHTLDLGLEPAGQADVVGIHARHIGAPGKFQPPVQGVAEGGKLGLYHPAPIQEAMTAETGADRGAMGTVGDDDQFGVVAGHGGLDAIDGLGEKAVEAVRGKQYGIQHTPNALFNGAHRTLLSLTMSIFHTVNGETSRSPRKDGATVADRR